MANIKYNNIDWFGDIPTEWNVNQIGNYYELRNEKVNDYDFAPLSVTMKGVVPQLATAAKSNDHSNRKLVKKGDFVINSRSDRRGSCGISPLDGSVSLINTVMEPRGEMNPQYYNWLFHTEQFADEFYKWGHGIVDDLWTTRWQEMKKILIVAPELDEQQAIADYLDEKCTKIDEIIAAAKASIEEYKDLKQSVIFEAVTKGLDKNVEMKESGVEWIKKTPFNWKVAKLGKCIEILPGYAFSSADFSEKGIRLLRGVNVTPSGARWDDVVCWDKEISDALKAYLLEEGDIVVGLDRTWISDGARIFIMSSKDLPCLLLQRVCRIRCKKNVRNEYLYYWLKSKAFEEALTTEITGISVPHISTNQIKDFKIAFPSKSEQDTIIEHLNKKTKQIDFLITEKRSLIKDLEAYKKSLIYEVVTGKRRVV